MKFVSWVLALASLTLAPCSIPASGSGGVNAPDQRDKPYLILISIDGFRWDYPDLYDTPAIDKLAERGIKAESLEPVYPTLTFPNHYSIATGLYPANHGIVANDFPDSGRTDWYLHRDRDTVQQGRWYGGKPIWVAAEKNGMVSAAFFWIGTEAPIAGVRPTHWNKFDENVPAGQRVSRVLDWLAMPAETRPHFITLYFEQVDRASHDYGIGSAEAARAIERIDRQIGRLLSGVAKLPHGDEVYVVLVSDHGQSGYQLDEKILAFSGFLDLDGISVVEGGTYAYLFFEAADPGRARNIRDAINRSWRQGRAWLPGEAPESWHVTPDSRFPDVILQPDPGFGIVSSREKLSKMNLGDHGWAPSFKDMHGVFIAAGPRLPEGQTIGTVKNVDIYPLMMEILELPISTPIDGDTDRLTPLLEPR